MLHACATPGVNTTNSVFYHDGKAIRLTHATKAELTRLDGIDTDVFGPVSPWAGLVYATPGLIWVNKTRVGCPPDLPLSAVACGFIQPVPPGTGEWDRCEIYEEFGRTRLTTGSLDIPGFPEFSSLQSWCYQAISGNSTLNLIAASITASASSDTTMNGILVVRENGTWRSPNYPGKDPEGLVADTAVNHQGNLVAYTLRNKAHLLTVGTDQTTECIDGRQIAFGKFDNQPAIATARGNTIRIARISNCDFAVRTDQVSGSGAQVVSMDWNEFSGKIVYIKQVEDRYSIHEYSVAQGTHTEIIGDDREKFSISIVRP